VAGIADRTGSITPGKKADLVIIDGQAVNVAPIIDPVGAVVGAADISNVKTVMVNGVILKRDGKLVADLAGPRAAVMASRDYLVSQVPAQEGWIARLQAEPAAGGRRSGPVPWASLGRSRGQSRPNHLRAAVHGSMS